MEKQYATAKEAGVMTSRNVLAGLVLGAVLLLAGTLVVIQGPADAAADESPPAEMVRDMLPVMGDMVGTMMNGMFKELARPESARRLAAFTRNYYEALLEEGFTEGQAMEIATAFSVPNLPSGK